MSARAWPHVALACGAAIVAMVASADAKPRAKVDVSSQVSSNQVAVGQRFTVTLRARSNEKEPSVSRPSLSLPAEIESHGSNSATHTELLLRNGQQYVSRGIDVVWSLRATKPGHYTIPGPTAVVDGNKVSTGAMTIEVIAGPPIAQPGSPFLVPGMPGMNGMPKLPWPFGDDPTQVDEPPKPSNRADLDMKEAAPDARAFVRAIIDKPNAVVGEQVTVRYYIYCAVSCIPELSKDPDFVSFRRIPLDRGEPEEPIGDARVHGEPYKVKLEGRSALFPLTIGDLQVGAMQLSVRGRRFAPGGELRVSNAPVIHVTEPPMAGRPPGYAIGDVGAYTLTTTIAPRKTEVGGSISVSVRVAGTGLVPDVVRVPQRSGVEWLDPEKKEQIDVQAGKVAGSRTLGFVVKLKNAGTIDLGKVELPFWDPATKKYQVATAALGEVEVAPAAAGAAPADADDKPAADDPIANLPAPRKELGAWSASVPSEPFAGPRFWGLLFAPPVGLVLVGAGASARRSWKKRREEGAASPRAAAERALEQAKAAASSPREAAAAVERAVHASVEAAYGVKSRGLLLEEIPAALAAAGAPAETGTKIRELLAACDEVRFVPGDAANEATSDLLKRADAAIPAVLRDARGAVKSARAARASDARAS